MTAGVFGASRLQQNVITPTTKAADHDAPIAPADIVARGLMSQADWDAVRSPQSPLLVAAIFAWPP
jgi:phosphoribosylaminoimidazole-succinocarboxamide synthase